MSAQKKFFSGEFGDDAIDLVRGLIHVSPLEDKSRYYHWRIAPHAHSNLFQLFLLETGTATLLQGDQRYPIEGPSFFTVPVNVPHGLEMQPNVTGWVISLSDKAVQEMLRLDADIIFRIDEIQVTRLNPADELVAAAYSTMHKCIAEYNSHLPARSFALQYLVGMLLTRLYRLLPATQAEIKASDNVNKLHFRRFGQLIKEAHDVKKGVAAYAQELGITPGHLNRVCRSVAGQSPKDIILDFYIGEAQRLLLHFEFSIAEISYQLHFEDPAYFTRLFKKKTGRTPKEYREQAAAS